MDWVFKSDGYSFVLKGLIFLLPEGGGRRKKGRNKET
jgi:hypothetical protein